MWMAPKEAASDSRRSIQASLGLLRASARFIDRLPIVRTLAGMTRLKSLLELDSFHATFLKMNASGVVFVAALNGSALAVGAEFAWACDLRIMADGDFVIGLSEVLTRTYSGRWRLPAIAAPHWHSKIASFCSRR